MLNTIIGSIIGNADISIIQFIVPILSALILGFILAKVSMGDNRSSKGFIVTLALLPAIVCVVIMAVNGNIGAGVAVAGAFSLVRFRSAQGTAKEIAGLFLAMTIGLLTGIGYVFYAFIFELIMIAVMVLYRTDSSRNSETGGFGIGLSMALAITEAHHGRISATSEGIRSITFTAVI